MRNLVIVLLFTMLTAASMAGCSDLLGPKETKTFKLAASGGYRGKPVGNCDQRNADRECRALGWKRAVDWDCRSVHVSGGFWGSWDQDVMYSVTCTR